MGQAPEEVPEVAPQDRVQAVDYVAWYNLQSDSLNRADVSLAQLEQITVASAGELRKKEGSTVEFTPLLTTSPQAMVVSWSSPGSCETGWSAATNPQSGHARSRTQVQSLVSGAVGSGGIDRWLMVARLTDPLGSAE